MNAVVPGVSVPDTARFVGLVEEHVRELIAAEDERWRSVVAPAGVAATAGVAEMHGHLASATLGGGKRLRPRFCYLGHVGVTGDRANDAAVVAGAALELLHAFALVHDDIMDGSATRRGVPALHVRLGEEHARLGGHGERRRAAEGMAVLIGDQAFTLAHRLAADLPARARRVWHDLCAELVVGQRLDLRGSASGERGIAYAQQAAALKSARYTVVGPLLLGAATADGTPGHDAVYEAYGGPLGAAFQLRDDLLGIFGDPEATGKPVGEDLREGRPTLLLALAHQAADAAGRRVLARVGREDLDDGDVSAIIGVLVRTGARAEVERRIDEAVAAAVAALADAPLRAAAVTGLRRIAQEVSCRVR